jgi:hypothetical protein
MRKAAISRTIRMNTAPPMMPPSSGVVSPLVGVPDAADLAIAVAAGVVCAMTPLDVGVSVGRPGTVAEVIVVVRV